ncbi:MAG: branched-chain amino acid ABC transporter permease [Nitrospinota bacterium]|nr:branched-chain amino acid ABC transporter permease [Nitrospinota bacterium]
MFSAEKMIILTYSSFAYAALLFLLASGLSLIFGVMRIVNLAHAAFFLFSGYIALEFYNIIYGTVSLIPRFIQIISWTVLYFVWKSISKKMSGGRSALLLLVIYLIIEIFSLSFWSFPIYENLFFVKVPVKSVANLSIWMLIGALIFTIIIISLAGFFVERVFLRQLGQDTIAQVLVTIGFAFILQDGSLYMWGGDNYFFDLPKLLGGSFTMQGMTFEKFRLFLIFVAAIVAIALYFCIERTKLGAIMRATVDDPEMARGVGINTNIVSMSIFAIGTSLAAIGGIVGASFLGVYPGLDFEILPYAFAVVIIGGMGSLGGALVGSIIVGLIENFATAFFPELNYFALFAPMAIILAVKPTGLFGKG